MRLRIAPSPTGMLHVGNARAALYNWLYAKRHNATYVLRIEDTDEARGKPEWTQGIIDSLHWLGITWDEGPYFQSANRSLHDEAAARLFSKGSAYFCECTREQLEARTGDPHKGYDRFCRDRNLEDGEGRALRFRVPEGKTTVRDLVRGEVVFDNDSIEDFVVRRSNGAPLYLLANVVDDVDQHISHVVRGEDHLPNTPKQMLLWAALSDQPTPVYAHLPLLVNEQGKKMSKRRDKVAVEQFRDEGYLPEALRNYLSLLGWAPKGDREIVPIDEMVAEFDLANVQSSPARFDYKKLDHFNGEYIRLLSLEEFVVRVRPFVGDKVAASPEFAKMVPLVQSRVNRLDEVLPMIEFLFSDVTVEPDLLASINDKAVAVLTDALKEFEAVEWRTDALHALTAEIGDRHELKLGKAQAPIRLAVTGKKVGPPLFEALEVLGRSTVIARLTKLSEQLSSR